MTTTTWGRNAHAPARTARGFTLLESLLAVTVLGVVTVVAMPAYRSYVERARLSQVCADFTTIESEVVRFDTINRRYPDTLADIGMAHLRDPWGRPFRFLNLTVAANLNNARKDRNLHPINSDFDLYSVGPDNQSATPLTAQPSQDDIIRARNGSFCGYVRDYN